MGLVSLVPLAPVGALVFAALLWPRPHACPRPVQLAATSYRTHAWRIPACRKCALAPVRRVVAAVLAVCGIAVACAMALLLVLMS